MTREQILALAEKCGIFPRLTPDGTDEVWSTKRDVEAFFNTAIESYKAELLKEESALEVCNELDSIVMVMPYDYLDPPDGGNVPMAEQVSRMWSEVKLLRENVSDTNELREQLAASQAYAEQLREALKDLFNFCINKHYIGHQALGLTRCDSIEKALALPLDTGTLDFYVVEKVKELINIDKDGDGFICKEALDELLCITSRKVP